MQITNKTIIDDWTDLDILHLDNTPLQGLSDNKASFIKAKNISKEVCNHILNKSTTNILTTKNAPMTVCLEINEMVFDFANAGSFGIKCQSNDDCADENQYCSTNSKTCATQTDCPDGEWNFDTDSCGTCESVNGDIAPIPSTNGCISCAESTDDAKPIWDSENKTCVNCQSDIDCETDSYCANTTCTNCPANSGTVDTNNGKIPDTSCYCDDNYTLENESCVSNCPANSSTDGTGNVTSNPLCICNSDTPWWNENTCKACDDGYKWDGNTCVVDIASACSGGFIVTTNSTNQKYCVNATPATSYAESSSWCTARGMDLVPLSELCPNNPTYGGNCPNLIGLTSHTTERGFWALTSTNYDANKFVVLIGPLFNNAIRPGYVRHDATYLSSYEGKSIFALCQ